MVVVMVMVVAVAVAVAVVIVVLMVMVVAVVVMAVAVAVVLVFTGLTCSRLAMVGVKRTPRVSHERSIVCHTCDRLRNLPKGWIHVEG